VSSLDTNLGSQHQYIDSAHNTNEKVYKVEKVEQNNENETGTISTFFPVQGLEIPRYDGMNVLFGVESTAEYSTPRFPVSKETLYATFTFLYILPPETPPAGISTVPPFWMATLRNPLRPLPPIRDADLRGRRQPRRSIITHAAQDESGGSKPEAEGNGTFDLRDSISQLDLRGLVGVRCAGTYG
jgi:hypothetical protein